MIIVASVLLIVLGILNLFVGSVDIPIGEIFRILAGNSDNEVYRIIVMESRLPQTITAILSGSALSVGGLIMQTTFNNPLAGPSVLGISTASSLGVAIVTFLFGNMLGGLSGSVSVIIGSLIGSGSVLILLIFLSSIIRNNLTLLIVGMMISYLSSSAISILNFFGAERTVKNFVVWGMGSFSGVTLDQIPTFSVLVTLGLFCSILMVKPLNILLLGDNYAQNLGINLNRTKSLLILVVGVLISIVTAYCGPVSFIGLATPHIARLLLRTSNHTKVLPLTILVGACIALICNLLCILPGDNGNLPLNAITPLFGAPIIIYVLMSKNKIRL